MHTSLQEKQPAVVDIHGPILPRDNARPHTSKNTMHKLKELKYKVLPHPPYSPDLSPTDYQIFKHFEHFIKEKNFKEQLSVENSFNLYASCVSFLTHNSFNFGYQT